MLLHSEILANGIVKLSLTGRMDILGVEFVDSELNLLAANPDQLLLVDLSGVSFMGSVGLRVLHGAAKTIIGNGGHVVLCNPNTFVTEVLNTSGTSNLIPVYRDFQDAVEGLSPKTQV